jgi:transcriptional regulator with XRE-family HTH domain
MSEQIDPEVGRRVEQLRRRAGLSREKLGALAEISPVTIKFIERGDRALTLRTAQRIAPQLGVRDLGELYGPAVTLSLDGRTPHPYVPEVRRALTNWHLTVQGEAPQPGYLRGAVDAGWRTWHTSPQQRTEAGALIPDLLDQTQRAARLLDGEQRRQALPMLAEAYHLAQAYLAWHGDRELVWLAVDRAMSAALESDDPLAIAGATWYAAHVLRPVGRSEEALDRLREARELIEPQVADGPPEYAAMLTDLHLATALTKARTGDQSAWSDWSNAADVAHRALPDGYVHPWTRVGPVLVDVYSVMLAVDLHDTDEARRRAQSLDPTTIPSTERRARHYIELARMADMDGSPEATQHLLSTAASISPETVRFSPPAQEMVERLVRGPASIRADAVALAERIGVPV